MDTTMIKIFLVFVLKTNYQIFCSDSSRVLWNITLNVRLTRNLEITATTVNLFLINSVEYIKTFWGYLNIFVFNVTRGVTHGRDEYKPESPCINRTTSDSSEDIIHNFDRYKIHGGPQTCGLLKLLLMKILIFLPLNNCTYFICL